ncbi:MULTISPECIES: PRC-barrel domain-containing protein [Pseudoalteromonas]|uniref:PRC-barrel domain-containing protein n=1 Tax=Pseudoalteromonas TaxID=53246 RepID=UPI0004018FD3|nr:MULTISPECIES: PRC-barrel domain-containing protein [Pseudoalteromonas]PKG68464.1 photosystem reaction center subunit H [Pseudoalteromonas arctica]PKG68778.1 photosystem reaction center subunit H [Pseudoalteromonas sp. GutCa3]
MLRSMKDLEGCAIAASDGIVGKEKDFLFDDLAWVIRYFVVETGTWLSSRKVLISPIAVQNPNWDEKIFPVLISKDQVKNSPGIDTNKPVSRQHEMDYLNYYGYPYYWIGTNFWGSGIYPYSLYPGNDIFEHSVEGARSANLIHKSIKSQHDQKGDPNLRSCKAIIGYNIHAKDGDIGHVSGFLVEENTWAVRYLIVETSNWWGGHQALIPSAWIYEVQWLDNSISTDLVRKAIKDAPVYEPNKEITQDFEAAVFHHYELAAYWEKIAKTVNKQS